MKKPIVFMYSGQGSQYYQMGRDLYEENNTFKKWMLKADKLHQSMTKLSIIDHLYNDKHIKSQPFTQTLVSHPAIFIIEYALTQVLLEKNIHPDIILGASMGEFAAATAAGVMDFETGLSLVINQAQALEDCPAAGMLAILNKPELYNQQVFLNKYSELAAINFASHFVVSGKQDDLTIISRQLNERNITSQLLPVSRGFHSALINQAKNKFLEGLKVLQLQKTHYPYFSCLSANSLDSITVDHFWEAIRQPILFQQSVQILEKQQPLIYIDIGPSGTLATFIKYNLPTTSQSMQLPILTQYGNAVSNLDRIEEVLKDNI